VIAGSSGNTGSQVAKNFQLIPVSGLGMQDIQPVQFIGIKQANFRHVSYACGVIEWRDHSCFHPGRCYVLLVHDHPAGQ